MWNIQGYQTGENINFKKSFKEIISRKTRWIAAVLEGAGRGQNKTNN